MALQLRWVGDDELDRVAEVRMRCYAHAARDIVRYREGIRADPRAKSGDFLLAEQDGVALGTSTSLSMQMWVRGGRVPCQGVAYVGTIKTHRRGAKSSGAGQSSGGGGVASQLMRETLRRARDRGEVVSALMPFRASFYEHFGYGMVETRNNWTVPLAVLPTGPFDGIRFYEPADADALVALRQRVAERGQCDIERPPQAWELRHKKAEDGFEVVDRPQAGGPVRGYLRFDHASRPDGDVLEVVDAFSEDEAALLRQLHFLASLRDQYHTITISLPVELPLHWLLKETQLPHRPVNHSTAKLAVVTRMQVKVLDHKRLIEAMHLPPAATGRVTAVVSESEGHVSRFGIDVSEGRAAVASEGGSERFECSDRVWAAVVLGEIPATRAAQLSLASATSSAAAASLDVFVRGPRPFCGEAF